jgi:hypothetical protein
MIIFGTTVFAFYGDISGFLSFGAVNLMLLNKKR